MYRIVRQCVLLCLLWCAAGTTAAAVDARLDRPRIVEGETVTLIVNVSGGGAGNPDPSPLVRDFDILNTSQSMRMSMINGRSSSSRGFQFVLAPKRSGTLTVPAIQVDGETTRPLTLEVVPAAQAAKNGPALPALIEADVDLETPYVQQKVIYTVRLLSRAPLRQVGVSEPQVRDAIVEPLGRETEYSSQRNGQQYRVVERRYAVFPQRSGSLEIEGPVLTAQLPEPNSPAPGRGRSGPPGSNAIDEFDRLFGFNGLRGLHGGSAATRPVRLRANAVKLAVRPQPAGSATPWLPAESLTLNEAWSPEPPVFRVGEPVTRTLVITAQGLSPSQLPDLAPEAPDGVKQYPDKAQLHGRVDGDTLVAQKLMRTAVVPSKPGRLTLPAVELSWWDTRQQQARVATLPARAVEVLPAAQAAVPSAVNDPLPANVARVEAPSAADSGEDASAWDAAGAGGGSTPWRWVAILLAVAWLLTLGLWLRQRRAASRQPLAGPAKSASPVARVGLPARRASLRAVEAACLANDAAAARKALLDWGDAVWPDDPPRRLETLAQRLGEPAAESLSALDQRLYAAGDRVWDGPAAWRLLSTVLARQAPVTKADTGRALPPLYPQRG